MVPIQTLETTRSESPSRAYSIPFFRPGTATVLTDAAFVAVAAAAVDRPRTPEALPKKKTKRNETKKKQQVEQSSEKAYTARLHCTRSSRASIYVVLTAWRE
jgi:imidazolonepropionase-like amidohydrolase